MRRVFATRPAKQNSAWAARLRRSGYDVVEIPLIEIIGVEDKRLALAKSAILKLNEYEKLIFVSQNAVDHAIVLFDEYWPQLPLGLTWLAVGARTAESLELALLEYYDLRAGIVSAQYAMNSEALLALDVLSKVEHQKILIFRGCGGRPKLADTLVKRGATVHYCELYTRSIPTQSQELMNDVAVFKNDILPVFSAESLENFVSLTRLKHKSTDLTQLTLVVPGERVADVARGFGFNHIFVAENAMEDSMLKMINSMDCDV